MMFKILIVGDRGVGKTSFLSRIRNGEFTNEYFPTKGVNVQSIKVQSDIGDITIHLWDVSDMRDYYFKDADGVILMGDFYDKKSIPNMVLMKKTIKKKYGLQSLLCLNKCPITHSYKQGGRELGINAQMNHNLLYPIIWLLHDLTGGKISKIDLIRDRVNGLEILEYFEDSHEYD